MRVATIPIVARNGTIRAYAIVDEADVELISQWTWRLSSRGYATAASGTLFMHRVILGLDKGDPREGDHVNHNKLDCRRENLRVVTRAEQMQNMPLRRGCSSRYRGVCWDNRHRYWVASSGGRWIGAFANEDEAGVAAAAARRKHMPFATN